MMNSMLRIKKIEKKFDFTRLSDSVAEQDSNQTDRNRYIQAIFLECYEHFKIAGKKKINEKRFALNV